MGLTMGSAEFQAREVGSDVPQVKASTEGSPGVTVWEVKLSLTWWFGDAIWIEGALLTWNLLLPFICSLHRQTFTIPTRLASCDRLVKL